MVRKLLVALVGWIMTGPASGTTYTYAGPVYAVAGAPFTTAMSITGTFTTAAPLPANMAYTDIGPYGSGLLTAWSFADGVHTYTQATSDTVVFNVQTDAKGNIVDFGIDLQNPRPPIVIGANINEMFVSNCCGPIYLAVDAAVCNSVNARNQCNGFPAATSASAPAFGGFTPDFAGAAPTIAKSFAPTTLTVNGTTALTFTLTNLDLSIALTGVAFSDNFPAGLVVATPDGVINTCGGVANAVSGAASVSLAGVTIAANSSCTLSVDVAATQAGTLANTTDQVTATGTLPGNTASATLMAFVPLPPPTIPALERWGLAVLALLLAMAGAVDVHRRHIGR